MVDLTDDLGLGPISVDGMDERESWMDRNAPLGFPNVDLGDLPAKWDWLASDETRFRNAIASDTERLIWIAPRSATEQSGLYWYLDRFGGEGAHMIVADQVLRDAWEGEITPRLGSLNEQQVAELLDEYPRVPRDEARFPANRWEQLVAENALIRVVNNGVLESAPDDFFDQFVLAQCSREWADCRRVIGNSMVSIWDAGHHIGDTLLTWRLRELIRQGKIACEGGLPQVASRSAQAARIRRIG